MKIRFCATDLSHWFAIDPEIGWVMFPAEFSGCQKRKPALVIDPQYMREVPLRMGFNTGVPGGPISSAGAGWGPGLISHTARTHLTPQCWNRSARSSPLPPDGLPPKGYRQSPYRFPLKPHLIALLLNQQKRLGGCHDGESKDASEGVDFNLHRPTAQNKQYHKWAECSLTKGVYVCLLD